MEKANDAFIAKVSGMCCFRQSLNCVPRTSFLTNHKMLRCKLCEHVEEGYSASSVKLSVISLSVDSSAHYFTVSLNEWFCIVLDFLLTRLLKQEVFLFFCGAYQTKFWYYFDVLLFKIITR